MNEVINYLNECGVFFISTVDGSKPKVRPFGFAMDYNGKVCICTSNKKPFFSQIKSNPSVEICASKGAKWMRLYGDAAVSYTHLRAHETRHDLVCRLLLEKKKKK